MNAAEKPPRLILLLRLRSFSLIPSPAPLRDYLAAISLVTNGAKGLSALQLGRDLNASYKTAFVLCHKLPEALAADAPGTSTQSRR